MGPLTTSLAMAATLLTSSAAPPALSVVGVQQQQTLSVEDHVRQIVVEHLGVDPKQVTPSARFVQDLGADSLDLIELVMAFEETFGIDYPDEAVAKMHTVGDATSFIKAALARR